jgi:hypothetical protein
LILEVEHQRAAEVGQYDLVAAMEVVVDLEKAEAEGQLVLEVEAEVRTGVVVPGEAEAVVDRETFVAVVQRTDHLHPMTQQAFAAVLGVWTEA